MYVADKRWQNNNQNWLWTPIIVRNPLPFIAAFWARMTEIAITTTFTTMTFTASVLFEELLNRADDLSEDCNSSNLDKVSGKLDEWRRHYDLVCQFVDKINFCFGPVLLIKIATGFASPIFDFFQILLTKGLVPRHYFEFFHTIFRFFTVIIVPSYLLTQQVT